MKTSFEPPEPSTHTAASGEITQIEYSPPASGDIERYQNEQYPEWIEHCRSVLAAIHYGRDVIAPPLILNWPIKNDGTRPADHARVEFHARGPLSIMRIDEPDEAATLVEEPRQHTPSLPSPPRPPAFLRSEKRSAPPSPEKTLWAADPTIYAPYESRLNLLKNPMRLGAIGSLSDHFAKAAIPHSVFQDSRNLSRYLDMSRDAASLFSAAPIPFRALQPFKRSPEKFYYDWPSDEPVKQGALTCELWRHQSETEYFEFEVQFTEEDEARGVVECTVHARNLTKPVSRRVVVQRKIFRASMVELATAMIDKCR